MIRSSLSGLRFYLLLLVLIAVVPALALVLFTAAEQRRQSALEAQNHALRLARLASYDQRHLIDSARQLLATVAQIPEMTSDDRAACGKLLAGLLEQFPRYTGLGVADLDGNVQCRAVSSSAAVNIADRVHFRRALETRQFAVGEYLIGRVSGKAVLNFGYPILQDDRPQGVVYAALDLEWLNRFVAEAQLPAGATVTVVDRATTILARYPDPEPWVGQTAHCAVLSRLAFQQDEGVAEGPDLDGVNRLHAFTKLGDSSANGDVFVNVGISPDTVFAEADQTLTRNLIGLGLATILALLVAWLVGDLLLLGRVNALLRAAERLKVGDLTVRMGTAHGPRELGQLSRAFDEMAASLEGRDLETRRALQSLEISEERFRSVAQTASDAIICIDSQGTIVFCNRVAEHISGYTGTELIGSSVTMLVPERHREQYMEEMRQAAASEQSDDVGAIERLGRRKDGTEITVEVSLATWQTKEGLFSTVIIRDVTERKWQEQKLAYLATHDALTGLPNRMSLEQALERVVARARRGTPSALLFMDADDFKQINDTLGHAAGDHALVTVAEVLRTQLRTEDMVARLGGDEFAMLLEGTNAADAMAFADRMRQAIEDSRIEIDGHIFKLTVSIGMVIIDGQHAPGMVLFQADAAMYLAKERGRNRVLQYRPEEDRLTKRQRRPAK